MRLFLIVLCGIFLSLSYLSCGSEAKHSSEKIDNKNVLTGDSLQFYTAEISRVSANQLLFPEGIRHVSVEPSNGRYKFLHDPAIVYHKNALIAAWYNCPSGEITEESCIRARRSFDGGISWTDAEVVADDKEKKGIYYVPAQLLSKGDNLYAFVGKMTGHDRIVNTTTYRYNELKKSWQELNKTADLFLPNCTPVKLNNGNWIMAGRVASSAGQLPLVPAVLISPGDSIENTWRLVTLPAVYKEDQYPETTLITSGKAIYAFTRADGPANKPDIFVSHNYGEDWTKIRVHDFNAISSKLYAGTLSDGRGYIVFNYVPAGNLVDDIEDRKVLAIAVSKDSENPFLFSTVYKIQSAGNGSSPLLSHYPCVLEHENNLYIVYTANFAGEDKRQCEMAIVPLKSLY